MGRPLRALLVDASQARRVALTAALEEDFVLTLECVQGAEGLTSALLRRGWDVVLYGGEGPDAVPPRKARAVVRLADPHLAFISVSPALRADDLLALVKGFDGDVPVVADPSLLAAAVRTQLAATEESRVPGGGHRLLLAQQEITDHMASALEPTVLLERVTASLVESLGFAYGAVWRLEDGRLVCESAGAAVDAGAAVTHLAQAAPGSTLTPGRGLPGRVFAFRRAAWVPDVREDAHADAVGAGLVCGVAFPITHEEGCDGVITLYAAESREPDAELAAMLAAVGTQLGRYCAARAGTRSQAGPARDDMRYLDVAGTLIVVLDTEGAIKRLNQRACVAIGCDEDGLAGRDWFETTVPEGAREARRALFKRLVSGRVPEEELHGEEATLVTLSGDHRTVVWHSTLLRSDDGEVIGTLASGEDVTDARRTEEQIKFLAYHDPLTGLPNRSLLEEHLKLALARTRRTETSLALLHVDLDNFKLVNDSLGHGAGDELLRLVSVRLQQLVRASDLLARVGGDEFLLLLADLTEDPLLVAERVAGEIHNALQELVVIAGAEFQVSASIGVAACPRDAFDSVTLLAHADAAMYQAKQVARGGWAMYAEGDHDPLARLSMTARLRRALRDNEFRLYYQPILDLATGKLVGVEALIRWFDPDHGMVSPADFIPVAEETGLIESLGDWVTRAVCEQQVAWAARGLFPQISFNVSPRQLKRLDFADCVAGHIEETGADPHRLTVELTESSTFADHYLTEPILLRLHELGLNIALDDFGSGYSSLSRLREMPVETLKIDRAFLREVPESREAAAIVTAILRLSRALGRTAVAEGVETEEQRAFLIDQRCPLAQGFLFGKPAPPEDLELVMAQAVGVRPV